MISRAGLILKTFEVINSKGGENCDLLRNAAFPAIVCFRGNCIPFFMAFYKAELFFRKGVLDLMMNLSQKQRVYRKKLAVAITLLMVFSIFSTVTPPAFASAPSSGSVISASLTLDNLTIGCSANYDLSFTLGTSIDVAEGGNTPDTAIVLELDPNGLGFGLSELSNSSFTLSNSTVQNSPTAISAGIKLSSDKKTVTISPETSIAAGQSVTVRVQNVINPVNKGYNNIFATVYLQSVSDGATSNKVNVNANFTTPKLVITPDTLTMNVKMRNKINVSLVDENGGAFIAPSDVSSRMYSTSSSSDEFYPGPADEYQNNNFSIPAGNSSTVIYYRPTSPGTAQLYNQSKYYNGGYIDRVDSESIVVNDIPAIETNSWLSFNHSDTIAGEPVRIDLSLSVFDQEDKSVPQTEDVVVDIAAFSNYFNPESRAASSTVKLLQANADGTLSTPNTPIDKVTIPKEGANAGQATFYFVDTRATINGDYQITLEAKASGIDTETTNVNVDPAPSTHIVILPTESGTSASAGQRLPLQLQLRDQYENLSDPQPWTLSVMLSSSSATGRFYKPEDSSIPVDRIDFTENYRRTDTKIFYYENSVSSATPDTITAAASYLTSGDIKVQITEQPILSVTAPESDLEVMLFKELTISLKDAAGKPVLAGKDGVSVSLHDDTWNAYFYAQPSDNLKDINSIMIPAGESSVKVYYRANQYSIGSYIVKVSTAAYGGIESSPLNINVIPAAQTKSDISFIYTPFTAGVPGKVDISYDPTDQYGNPVPRSSDLVINLSAYNEGTEVTPDSWRFYQSDAEGKVSTPDVATVTIPKETSQASFYYSDTRSTNTGEYQPVIKVSSAGIQDFTMRPTINAGNVASIGIDALENNKTVSEIFPIQISLFDAFGNRANKQTQTLVADLTAQTSSGANAGTFYTSQYISSPITQLDFNGYQNASRMVYFKPSIADTITVTASTVNTTSNIANGTATITVKPAAVLGWGSTTADPIEVNILKKLTLQLAENALEDVYIRLSSDQSGTFYKQPANNTNPVSGITIPAGSKSIDVYYKSNIVGKHILSASTSAFGGVSATPLEIEIIPAGQTNGYLMLDYATPCIAGEKTPLQVTVYDQYNNPIDQTQDLQVTLKAIQPDGRDVSASSCFFAADSEGKATATKIDTIIIPAGKSSASFFYYDEQATSVSTATVPGYMLLLQVNAIGLTGDEKNIDVNPAMAKKIEVEAVEGIQKTTMEYFILNVSLKDSFGNIAAPQHKPLSLDLVSSSASGRFFEPGYSIANAKQIAQLNFQGTSQRQLVYHNNTAGKTPDTITISTTDLTPASLALTIVEPPVISLAVQSTNPEVKLFDKVSIQLDKALDYDLTICLRNDNDGQFYLNASDNAQTLDIIVIPMGSTKAELWYRPTNVGIHKIKALIDYPVEQVYSNEVELNVQPAGQVVFGHSMQMTTVGDYIAGEKGKVVLEITDQYNNPVKQPTGGLEVKLTADELNGNPLSESVKFYKANADETATTEVITSILVPEGESKAVFYFYDETATIKSSADSPYQVAISAAGGNMEKCVLPVTILPAAASQVKITSQNGTILPVYNRFELEMKLVDRFGNDAAAQQEPISVVLGSTSATGKFYDSNQQRITQITFSEGNYSNGQKQTVYFTDSEPAAEVKISTTAPNLTTGETTLKVLAMPKAITVGFGSGSWLIKERGQVKLSLFADEDAKTYYKVPAELTDGLNVLFTANPTGHFYDALVEGQELTDGVMCIPAGTEAKDLVVYFAPDTAGDVEIKAELTYAGDSYSGIGGSADIVWVLDHSGSMDDDQQNIARNITAFADQLQSSGVNYRLGFVYYANNVVNRQDFPNGLFTQDTSDFANKLINISYSCGGSGEVTMEAVQNALSYPYTGSKNIIIVTDEPGDDNHIYSATQAAVDAANAKVYAIWDLRLASSSMIDELVDNSDGLQLSIAGDWSSILSTLASSIISGTSSFDISATNTIKVGAAGGVMAVINGNHEITAGQAEKMEVLLVDQYNNRTSWPVDLKIDLKAITRDWSKSETGKFYAAAADGSIVTDKTIDSVTIPKNTESVFFYYLDSRASSSEYEVGLQTSSPGVEGYIMPIVIEAGKTAKIALKVLDYATITGLIIDNNDYSYATLPGIEGEQHNLLCEKLFPLEISIVDQNRNPVPMSTPLTVNLSSNTVVSTPDNVEVIFYEDFLGTKPITQVTIPANTTVVTVYVKGIGAGDDILRGQAKELGAKSEGTWAIKVLEPDRLKIAFPGEIPNEDEVYATPQVEPEQAKAFYVILTDSEGHPAIAKNDIAVKLSGSSTGGAAKFYLDPMFKEVVPSNIMTLKAGAHGFMCYVKGAKAEGDMSIKAEEASTTPVLLSSGSVALKVKAAAYFWREYPAGWNILSTPVKLDPAYASLQNIVGSGEIIEQAYAWDAADKKWLQIYEDGGLWRIQQGNNVNTSSDSTPGEDPEYIMQPMQAIYVKMDGGGEARYYPYRNPSGPYTLTMKNGWNLIGPSLDVRNDYGMAADQVLATINGSYTQVISPGFGYQDAWVYIPGYGYYDNYQTMYAGFGYWIYMADDNSILPGFGVTPISEYQCWAAKASSMQTLSLVDSVSPPALPAAYYGTVTYADGTPVASGTVEAMIDNVVYGSAEIKDGRFCTVKGAHLLVQYLNDNLNKKVEFVVNGVKADQSSNWLYDSGEVVEMGLTVANDTVAPSFLSASIDAGGTVITLTFSEVLLPNVSDLKSMVKSSSDGINFVDLAANDMVVVSGKTVVITLTAAITNGQIMIAPNALKDSLGNVLTTEVKTSTFDQQAPVLESTLFDSTTKQVITLVFNEKLYANTGNLKAAISIAQDGVNFQPLADADRVEIQDKNIVITLTAPISGSLNRVQLAAEALKDDSGNLNAAVTTDTIVAEGCFIATAAYGSYLDPHVWALRNFRDNVLRQTSWGSWFVNAYYENSPPIAAFIARYDSLRLLTRLLLTPLVFAVEFPGLALLLLLTLILLAFWRQHKNRNMVNPC